MMSSFVARLRNHLSAFRTAERGNVAIMFTLAVIPLVGFLDAAVDFSRVDAVKSVRLQAMDAPALMLSKDFITLTSGPLREKAIAYFKALFNHPDALGISVTPTYFV